MGNGFRLGSRRHDRLGRLAFGGFSSQIKWSLAGLTSSASSWIQADPQSLISANKTRFFNYAARKTDMTAGKGLRLVQGDVFGPEDQFDPLTILKFLRIDARRDLS